MPEFLQPTLERIQPVRPEATARAQARLDKLTKPPGSLGRLEELARRYVAIRGTHPPSLRNKGVYVFAADHGVTREGVSAYPPEVTAQMVMNFLNGGAAINVLARHAGAWVGVVDMGVDADFDSRPGLVHRKIGRGTQNFCRQPAMTPEQARRALQGGLDLADESAASRTDLLAAGEMGIGNTTAASAILSVITRRPVEAVTGRGTGIDDAALNRKREVIRTALARHRPESGNPLDVLGKVGGFEIGGIAGLILGAAAARIPVVVDGLISAAGAALAVSFKDTVRDYLFLSHRSREPGHAAFYEWLGERPLLDLDLRLGEGTGAVLALTLVDAAVKVYNEMATFEEAGVSSKGELSRP